MFEGILGLIPGPVTILLSLLGIAAAYFIFCSRPIENAADAIVGPLARTFGKRLNALARTKVGKAISYFLLGLGILSLILMILKYIFVSQILPIADSIEENSRANTINITAQSIYDNTSSYSGLCVFYANPFVNRDAPNQEIAISTYESGNSLNFRVEVTAAEYNISTLVGFRTMEFEGMRDESGKWSVERSSWTRGAFGTDESFNASMLHVLDLVVKNKCTRRK